MFIGLNDRERRADLRNCSLVCKGWVYKSRKNLFYYIRFYDGKKWNEIKEALRMLPHHVKDVRILELSASFEQDFKPNELLIEISIHLPTLKDLRISSCKFKLLLDDLSPLPFRFDAVETLTIEDTKIHTMKKFDALVNAFPVLQKLILDSVYLSRKPVNRKAPSFASKPPPSGILKPVKIYHDRFWPPPTPIHDWFILSPLTCSVTSFVQSGSSFQYTSGDPQGVSISKLLLAKGSSLTYLSLPAYVFRTKSEIGMHIIHILMCTTNPIHEVDTLKVCTSLQDFSTCGINGEYYIRAAIDALKSVASENIGIKRFYFSFLWTSRATTEEDIEGVWKEFDDVMCSGPFQKAESVCIGFQNYVEEAVDIGIYLPRLFARGILELV